MAISVRKKNAFDSVMPLIRASDSGRRAFDFEVFKTPIQKCVIGDRIDPCYFVPNAPRVKILVICSFDLGIYFIKLKIKAHGK